MQNKLDYSLKPFIRKYLILLIWFLIFLILVQSLGIAIHEFGHYLTGRLYGCENLSISLSKLSFEDSLSNVSGWETCKIPAVVNAQGNRICNAQTNIIGFAGLFFTLIFFIPFAYYLNVLIKKKAKIFALNRIFLFWLLFFIVCMTISSAKYDLFKIAECWFNIDVGQSVFNIIQFVPAIFTYLLVVFITLDILLVIIPALKHPTNAQNLKNK